MTYDPYAVRQIRQFLAGFIPLTGFMIKEFTALGDRFSVSCLMALPGDEIYKPDVCLRVARVLRAVFAAPPAGERKLNDLPFVSVHLLERMLERVTDMKVRDDLIRTLAELKTLLAVAPENIDAG